jgi:hypothetical protein
MRHGRRDVNHAEIRDALLACGCSVRDTADLGDDFPDLVVGRQGRTYLLEVKAPKGKEREGQTEARTSWRGGPWKVVRSLAEALAVVGITA